MPLTEILYLDLLNSNGGILLKLDVEKFVGYLGVGLQNLFQKIFGAVKIWFKSTKAFQKYRLILRK